jgi:DNA adenine methylase
MPTTPSIELAKPFLKWAGGKSRLLQQYQPYLPDKAQIGRYFEPFLGSAALFFHLQPHAAYLADVNENLVEIYEVVQRNVEELIQVLGIYQNNEMEYYRVRSQNRDELNKVERAARLIYLNRTCYNGLYRENKKGEFNVPFGRYKNPKICNTTRLRKASQALQEVAFQVADFEVAVEPAGSGDFVYFDPPYVPLNATSSFTSYNRYGFGAADQRRLAATFQRLTSRGCGVMLSNSSAPLVYELYGGKGYRVIEIEARRSINSNGDGRGPVTELLILSA